MMHASSESDTTSTGVSSSPRDYYVQSPSRDSHDDTDKCSSTIGRSPFDSPALPKRSSPALPKRSPTASSTSSASSKSSTWTGYSRVWGKKRRRWKKYYCDMVEEEEVEEYNEEEEEVEVEVFEDDEEDVYYGNKSVMKEWGSVIVVVAFGVIFGGICFTVWAASKHYKPHVTTQSIMIESMGLGEGVDSTGVPSKLISLNCSANLVIYNPATLFGMQIASHTANLIFSQVTIARGELQRYYHPRKSRRAVRVKLVGREVPLYGAAMELRKHGHGGGGGGRVLPLTLEVKIDSSGCLTKHTVQFSCFLRLNFGRTNQSIIFHNNSCQYF